MNISIISTYRDQVSKKEEFVSEKISRVLLEIAESQLLSPETRHYISEDGIKKVRKKLNAK